MTVPASGCAGDSRGARPQDLATDRLARYEAFVDLASGLLPLDDVAAVWSHMARHFRFLGRWQAWRLVIVTEWTAHTGGAVLADGGKVRSWQCLPEELDTWDRAAWDRWLPRWVDAAGLAAADAGHRPWPLDDAQGRGLWECPLHAPGGQRRPLALLSILARDDVLGTLDRKFARMAGEAVANRVLALDQAAALQAQRLESQARQQEQQRAQVMLRLTSGLRHEINTPLAAQGQWIDLLQEAFVPGATSTGEERDALVTLATRSLRDAQTRIVRIMDAIKACSGSLIGVGPEAVSLLPWLAEYLAARRQSHPAQAIEDSLAGAADGVVLKLDPHALGRVLDELLDNIVKHAPGATAHVTLELDPRGVALVIDDNGPGWQGFEPDKFALPFVGSLRHQGRLGLGGFIARNLSSDLLGATLALTASRHGGVGVQLLWPHP